MCHALLPLNHRIRHITGAILVEGHRTDHCIHIDGCDGVTDCCWIQRAASMAAATICTQA